MPQIDLKYGAETICFDLPDQAHEFHINEPEKKITPDEFASKIRQEMDRLKPDMRNPAIVVADKTRQCGYPEYLPPLLQALEEYGTKPDNITFYIAYGTHPRQSDEESYAAYGDVYGKYRFVHHDCTDKLLFNPGEVTRRGTKVFKRSDIGVVTFLITFGAISHHYFAGYGGGRKLLFPGLGFRDAIYQNHSLFLDKEARTLSPLCQPGILDGNPLAEDLAEYETYCPVDIAIHGILNSRGEVCGLKVGGGTEEHFRNACAEHGKNCEISTPHQYDRVIASCGGHPKDINFIQSHKAIHNAAKFVSDGGELIILAKCPDGVGSQTFLPWFEMGREAAFDKLAEDYQGNGGTALSMMSKTGRIRIRMVTELPDNVAELIDVKKIGVEEAVKWAGIFSDSLAVIPNASLVVRI